MSWGFILFIILLVLFTISEVLLLWAFIRRDNKLPLKSTVMSLLFIWLTLIATYIVDFFVPYIAFIFVMISMLIHGYFGYYRMRYTKSKYFDRIAHVIGSFAFAIFFYYFLSNFFQYGSSRLFQAFYIMLLGLSIGAVYEIVEFAIDAKHRHKLQHGLKDTDFDLVSDLMGSIAAAALAFFVLF